MVTRVNERSFMAGKKTTLNRQAAREQLSPLERCEQVRIEMGKRVDERLKAVGNAVGEEQLNETLHAALAAHRQYVAFSHEMFLITSRSIYENRSRLEDRVGSDFLRQRIRVLKGTAMKPVKLPSKSVLDELRASWPKPPVTRFEGENEWQEHLQKNGLVESDPNAEYESLTIVPEVER
jgi:hypothetical protein